ncbi:TadE/TadG family type IV pilus assembly protein [Streptomyces sp. NPDC001970]
MRTGRLDVLAAAVIGRRLGVRHRERDRGQTAVEFVGMLPIILGTCVMLWQAVLYGYTYTLAANAADRAAHEVAVMQGDQSWTAECNEGARLGLADNDFRFAADCDLDEAHQSVRASVEVPVPVLLPGFIDFPFSVTGEASSPQEG